MMNIREQFAATSKRRQLLVKAMPEVMSRVSENTKKVHSSGALDAKTKEFVSLGMSIMIMCDECILHHTIALYDLGCTREEFCECLETAITLQSCPGLKYSQLALEYYDELVQLEENSDNEY